MGKVVINDSTLSSIGSAIREKTYTTKMYKPNEMAQAIRSIQTHGDISGERFVFSGNLYGAFEYGMWDWFVEDLGEKITTRDITNIERMFYSSNLEVIPFDFNFATDTPLRAYMIFSNCPVREINGTFRNLYMENMDGMFLGARQLRYLPNFEDSNTDYLHDPNNSNVSVKEIFYQCNSLREIPEDFLKQLYTLYSYGGYTIFRGGFSGCYSLDEIRGLSPKSATYTSNIFSGPFNECYRVKDIVFDTQEDGTPYTVEWANQVIRLDDFQGYATNKIYITKYNSGITADKEVKDATTYQALKNDPDWFTTKLEYSRYNRISAVNTINSLPDTSAFLATNGGTNTIKFKGESGSLTDGGAINTLSEEEIAVATAKGWTVTFA